jgi:ABC-type Fe3+-hydroxamate transport system substrate-binding protein
MRIVSLLPSVTEIVYALGLGDQLEGRTFECDYPSEAQQNPIVSSSGLPENLLLGEIDDAVRAATAGETPYRLDEARIAQIQPGLISPRLTSLGRFGDPGSRRVLVLEWVDPPWGGGHWIPDMVELAGGEPVLGH